MLSLWESRVPSSAGRRPLLTRLVSSLCNGQKSNRGLRERHGNSRCRGARDCRQLIRCGKRKRAAVQPDTLGQQARSVQRVTRGRKGTAAGVDIPPRSCRPRLDGCRAAGVFPTSNGIPAGLESEGSRTVKRRARKLFAAVLSPPLNSEADSG